MIKKLEVKTLNDQLECLYLTRRLGLKARRIKKEQKTNKRKQRESLDLTRLWA